MTANAGEFVNNIRTLLESGSQPLAGEGADYLDLGFLPSTSTQELEAAKSACPVVNPVSRVFTVIVDCLSKNKLDEARIGINELLKAYLLRAPDEPSEEASRDFLEYVYLVALFFMQDSYPYRRQMWTYLVQCYFPVSRCLLNENRQSSLRTFVNHAAAVGRIAVEKKLDTSSIQHLLRSIEIEAASRHWDKLAAEAKERRHNLEL